MRGFLQPSVRPTTTETQSTFRKLSRGRRTKLAKAAHTTLVKADQWARGDAVTGDLAEALDRVTKAHHAKKK